jgi:hypothetical protein
MSHLPLILLPMDNHLPSSDGESPLVKTYSRLNVYVNIETGQIVPLEHFDERTEILLKFFVVGKPIRCHNGRDLVGII